MENTVTNKITNATPANFAKWLIELAKISVDSPT